MMKNKTTKIKTGFEGTDIKKAVKHRYGQLANNHGATVFSGCCSTKGCCNSAEPKFDAEYLRKIGYSEDDIKSEEAMVANLGLGCGNPTAIASLKDGEVVLDLGSGAGFDCFLAAKRVGEKGRVIGIDMTKEMIEKARGNAKKHNYINVEFIHGEIENMPLSNESVDVVISNCVINLSPDKASVFKEAIRVLKPGGRFIVSDIVATQEVPEHIQQDLALYAGCIAGATPISQLENMMREAGFDRIQITPKLESRSYIGHWATNSHAEDYVASAIIVAYKAFVK